MMRFLARLALAAAVASVAEASAQLPQNPSPMVEHTREHPRLTKTVVDGARMPLKVGTLFVPAKLKGRGTAKLLMFFHGGDWLPELAASQQAETAVIAVQAGAGSSTYAKLFADPAAFGALIAEAESVSGMRFGEIELGGWSAGCGALRQILGDPASYDRVSRVLCIDGVHAGYVSTPAGAEEPKLEPANLEAWLRFGRDALAGKKRLLITHSEIYPGTYASTSETADALLRAWGVAAHPVVRWGPMRTQMLSDVRSGGLRVVGFAGNSAPDHVDEMQSLPEYLKWLGKL